MDLAVGWVDFDDQAATGLANPMVSNGSLVTAPGWPQRLEGLKARGGKLVVIDPRRSETAEVADQHLAILPGTDAFLLLALVRVLFAEGLVAIGALGDMTDDHRDKNARMAVAAQMPGGNFNALTDADEWDSLSGIAVLNGIPVEIVPQ